MTRLLKIDLDIHPQKEWLDLWLRTRIGMLESHGYAVEQWHIFRTYRGHHIYITLRRDVDDETANMLQFLCGDDHTRVKINEWRIKRGIKYWNKLFHRVIYRRKTSVITCYYCGNKIPLGARNGLRGGAKPPSAPPETVPQTNGQSLTGRNPDEMQVQPKT